MELQMIRELLAKKLLRDDQLAVMREEQRRSGERMQEVAVRLGFVEEAVMREVLTSTTGLSFITEADVDRSCLNVFSPEEMQQRQFCVWRQREDVTWVALVDPFDVSTRDWLVSALRQRYGDRSTCSFAFISKEDLASVLLPLLPMSFDELASPASHSGETVSYLLDSLLQKAFFQGASDVHFQPSSHLVHVRFRLDGTLKTVYELHETVWANMVIRLKILANLDIAESRRPQSGHFERTFNTKKVDFRLSTHPTIHGESLVIRVLARNKELLTLNQLGFEGETVRLLQSLIRRPYGLILLCGPTGSGKTTTLYSLCAQMDSDTKNIMTLEDPVEYQFDRIRQTEIQHAEVMSFAEGVRSILRQDPDIILIGEIRDEETAQMALRASMTGHLVLSTIHANDVLSAPNRLRDLGLSPSQLSGQILAILSQRLVRRYCPHCAGKGCSACDQTGFKGRIALSEILEVNDAVDACLTQEVPWAEWRRCAAENGYRPLYQDGLQKVRNHLTSLEEVNRLCGRPCEPRIF